MHAKHVLPQMINLHSKTAVREEKKNKKKVFTQQILENRNLNFFTFLVVRLRRIKNCAISLASDTFLNIYFFFSSIKNTKIKMLMLLAMGRMPCRFVGTDCGDMESWTYFFIATTDSRSLLEKFFFSFFCVEKQRKKKVAQLEL